MSEGLDLSDLGQKFSALAESYRRTRDPGDFTQLRVQRVLIVRALLSIDASAIEAVAAGPLRSVAAACMSVGLRSAGRIDFEESIFRACHADVHAGWLPAKAATSGLGALLLSAHACELGFVPEFEQISPVLRTIWFAFLFEAPLSFSTPGDIDRYVVYLRDLCDRARQYLARANADSSDLIQAIAANPLFAHSYFTDLSFGDVIRARALVDDQMLDHGETVLDQLTLGRPSNAQHMVGPAVGSAPGRTGRKQRQPGGTTKKSNTAAKPADMHLQQLFATATKHHQENSLSDAKAGYLQVLERDPNHGGALNNLGLLESDLRNFDEAEALYKRAAAADPKSANALMNLGNMYKAQEKHDQALASYEQGLRIEPGHALTYINMGNALQYLGKVEQASASYQKALSLNSNLPEAHLNLGNILSRTNRSEEAVKCFEKALALRPDYAAANNNLGMTLLSLGRHDRAITCFEKALEFSPDYLDAFLNLGSLYKDLGKGDQAAAYYEKILAIDPDHPGALSNIAFSLNYSAGADPQVLAQQHFRSGNQIERKYLPAPQNHANSRDQNRRLRVGYVSPDFRYHAVTNFFEPLLRSHDRSAVEVFCYAEVFSPDGMTAKLQGMADHWTSTIGINDDGLAERIRTDQIDILVDLAGHSGNNRLAAFARKPAPVQATWLGYPNTTGLTNIDYRLVDAITDPPGIADSLASETLVRLEGGFLCYNTFVAAPDPVQPPCLKSGSVTFGSFNNLPKLSGATFDTWSSLLTRVPNSRLILKNRFLDEPGTRELVLGRFAERGIGSDRVMLLGGIADLTAHMAAYHDIDIGLDSFPYNGTTTTCEALWMGIPVVGLAGDRHLARVGASILTHMGAPELIARDQSHYVEIAAALATDIPRLTAYHAELRQRMVESPLCDSVRFARAVERAYREMWQRWCEKTAGRMKPSVTTIAAQ